MRCAPRVHRRKRTKAARIRHRRQGARRFDLPECDDDEESVVEVGGGPPDDKPASG